MCVVKDVVRQSYGKALERRRCLENSTVESECHRGGPCAERRCAEVTVACGEGQCCAERWCAEMLQQRGSVERRCRERGGGEAGRGCGEEATARHKVLRSGVDRETSGGGG